MIKKPDGAVFTVLYKIFQQISDYNNKSIFDEIDELNIPRKSRSNCRNSSANNSGGEEKTLYQMHREIDSLKVKFKDMEERNCLSCVKEEEKTSEWCCRPVWRPQPK